MPGIIGFVGEAASSPPEEFLNQMASALEPDTRFSRELFVDGGIGLGRIGLSMADGVAQPVWNRDRDLCIVMEGELYQYPRLHSQLDEVKDDLSSAAIMLALYESEGLGVLPELNGAFAAAVWDARKRRVTLVNDRLGLQPIYFARTPRVFLFGSGVRALLADRTLSRAVDPVAVAEFLTFDHVLQQRTYLREVELLPQGSTLEISPEGERQRRYWQPTLPDAYQEYDESASAERLSMVMADAVHHMRPDSRPAGLLLSGGLDSRVLLAAMAADPAYSNLQTFTWGIPGCDDARFAAQVARAVGSNHSFFELRPDWLLGAAEDCVRTTDGMGNLVNLHAFATLEQESQLADIIYKGFLGDALLGFGLRPRYWGSYADDMQAHVHIDAYRDYDVLTFDLAEHYRVFPASFRRDVGDGVLEDYRKAIDQSGSSGLAAQRIYIDLTQRVPRMTLNGVLVARQRTTVRLPFADNDLVEFGMGLPPGMLFERKLLSQAFIKTNPKLAQIPTTPTGEPMVACARKLQVDAQRLVRWHLRQRGLGRLAGPGIRPYKDYDGWFRGVLRPWMESIVLSRSFEDREYLRPEVVRRLVEEHMAGANHAVKLSAILTLELWHRMYVD